MARGIDITDLETGAGSVYYVTRAYDRQGGPPRDCTDDSSAPSTTAGALARCSPSRVAAPSGPTPGFTTASQAFAVEQELTDTAATRPNGRLVLATGTAVDKTRADTDRSGLGPS